MVVVCVCVAGGCRGPLFVLGPFVLAGDGLRGGAFVMGAFRVVFFICGKDHGCSLLFLASSVRKGRTFYFWITARPRTFGVWWLFVLFLSGFWAFHCFLILLI